MGLFWKSNGKKVSSSFKNFGDSRYKKNGNRMRGSDKQSNLAASMFNALMKK